GHQRNVQTLARVLQDHAREDPDRPVPHPLGRLLFEWRYVPTAPLSFIRDFVWLDGLVLLASIAGALAVMRRLKGDPLSDLAVAFACYAAVLALQLFLQVWRRWVVPRLHGHERGVVLVHRGKERLLPFDWVGELIWKRKMKFSLRPFPGA